MKAMRFKSVIILYLLGMCHVLAQKQVSMAVGTYTDGGSRGIYTYHFNQETGEATRLDSLEMKNPSYLTVSDNKRYIYAVSETDAKEASLNIIGLDKRGGMRLLESYPNFRMAFTAFAYKVTTKNEM